MSTIKLSTQCPNCKKQINLSAEVPNTGTVVPATRSNLQPIGDILVYKITSEDLKKFIMEKAKFYCKNVKMEIVPRYCEKKRRRDNEPHRSYASLRIAFSEDILVKKEDLGWYGKIGESADNLRIENSIFTHLIKKYGYNTKDLEAWLKSYRNLEELEECLGMTESYISDLKTYSTPQRITTTNGEKWIFFAAAAENVIKDMLEDPETGMLPGRLQIHDVYKISDDIVEFVVYLHPQELKMKENPHVRQILMGSDKKK